MLQEKGGHISGALTLGWEEGMGPSCQVWEWLGCKGCMRASVAGKRRGSSTHGAALLDLVVKR